MITLQYNQPYYASSISQEMALMRPSSLYLSQLGGRVLNKVNILNPSRQALILLSGVLMTYNSQLISYALVKMANFATTKCFLQCFLRKKVFEKKISENGGTSGTSGTNPYQATITHVPLLSRCNTTERSARRKMEKEKAKKSTNDTQAEKAKNAKVMKDYLQYRNEKTKTKKKL